MAKNTFNTTTEGWTAYNSASTTLALGHLEIVSYNASAGGATKSFTTVVGKRYRLSFDFMIYGVTAADYVLIGNGGGELERKRRSVTKFETIEFTADATTTTLKIELIAGNYGRLVHVDNVLLEEIFEVGEGYTFGFNGKEADDETYGEGNAYDFAARILDTRLGRWLSLDPSFAKYPHLNPYNSVENNPIYFNDPDGKDAGYTIKGNTITFTAQIYIMGSGATKEKAAEIQKEIMKVWGADFKSKGYNVKFDIQVDVFDKTSKEQQANFKKGTANLVGLSKKNIRDYVNGDGKTGVWSENEKGGVRAHETGHFLGLDDAYYTEYYLKKGVQGDWGELDIDYPGTPKDDVMGQGVHSAKPKVKQFDIDALVTAALENKENKKDAVGDTVGTIKAEGSTLGGTTPEKKAEYYQPRPLGMEGRKR